MQLRKLLVDQNVVEAAFTASMRTLENAQRQAMEVIRQPALLVELPEDQLLSAELSPP
jgi:hypothetical protein